VRWGRGLKIPRNSLTSFINAPFPEELIGCWEFDECRGDVKQSDRSEGHRGEHFQV